jgi:PBP1b-binding outer membrane lipoprotein LpoB
MPFKTKVIAIISAAFMVAGLMGCASSPREVQEEQSITTMDLDIQNFNNAAKDLTNQMLLAPRVQQALATAQQENNGKLPLIKISRITNDTDLKINMVTYLVTPIEEVFTNSGKADYVSEDKTGQDIAAAQEAMGNGSARLPDFVLYGRISQLDTGTGGTEQSAYVFHVRLAETRNNTVVFIGDKQILKQQKRAGLSF